MLIPSVITVVSFLFPGIVVILIALAIIYTICPKHFIIVCPREQGQ